MGRPCDPTLCGTCRTGKTCATTAIWLAQEIEAGELLLMVDRDVARRRAEIAAERRSRSWVPERADSESDDDYSRRYARAEFRAMLDGNLRVRRNERRTPWGTYEPADPAGGRFG